MTAEGGVAHARAMGGMRRRYTDLAFVFDRVFLRADGAVPYSEVMQILGALNAGGFSNVGLVTDTGGPSLDDPEG